MLHPLGILTALARTIQQAIAQPISDIYEEIFSDIICKILKEKGKMPDILDYGLATHNPVSIINYGYGLKNKLADWSGTERRGTDVYSLTNLEIVGTGDIPAG